MARITYRDFILLFSFTPGGEDEFDPALDVRADGVYVKPLPDRRDLSHEDALALTRSMSGDFSVPEIRFPCSLDDLEKFVDFHGLRGYIDAFKMARWLPTNKEAAKAVGPRAETTYLNIIGGLLGLMLDVSQGGQKGSVYESQTAIIDALLMHHEGKRGIAKSTIEEKFAAARH